MAADPENWGAYLAALFGAGGGGAALVKQIKAQARLEEQVADHGKQLDTHAEKLGKIETTLSRLDERSERAEEDRKEMLTILRATR